MYMTRNELRKRLRAIDRKHATPRIKRVYEYKYAYPPNIGDARNPLVFGRIPDEYAEAEKQENKRSLYVAQSKLFKCREQNYR